MKKRPLGRILAFSDHPSASRRGETYIAETLLAMLLTVSAVFFSACETIPHLVDYQKFSPGYLEDAPIIIVGQIHKFQPLGDPHPSHWDPNLPVQLFKVTVAVENVLRGNVDSAVVPVYYMSSIRLMGHTRMGMVGRGGHWQIGDRCIFFLRRDSGVLRTVMDTWAFATPSVLTGAHPGYRPKPKESIADSIIDIFLDRGEGCSVQQWAVAIATSHTYFYDLAYTIQKLRRIQAENSGEAGAAAKKELDDLSYSWPKIKSGWPDSQ